MPYLHCPGCRLSLYIAPTADRPKRCSRCGARLARAGASRVLEALRERRRTRGV